LSFFRSEPKNAEFNGLLVVTEVGILSSIIDK